MFNKVDFFILLYFYVLKITPFMVPIII